MERLVRGQHVGDQLLPQDSALRVADARRTGGSCRAPQGSVRWSSQTQRVPRQRTGLHRHDVALDLAASRVAPGLDVVLGSVAHIAHQGIVRAVA